jgi:hypothetical protein
VRRPHLTKDGRKAASSSSRPTNGFGSGCIGARYRYLGLDVLARSRLTTAGDPATGTDKEMSTTIPALSAYARW